MRFEINNIKPKLMKILDGKKISEKILDDISKDLKKRKSKPGLAVILIGNDKASELYVKIKKEKAKKIGIDFFLFRFRENSSEKTILEKIGNLNHDRKINGIIVQLPLPKKFHTQKIIDAINPVKDVDGFHPENIRLFLKGRGEIFPVFPQAIFKLIESSEQKLNNRKAIIISNSKLFGEIMLEALRKEKIKAEYILKKEISDNLEKIKKADILISAVGSKGIVMSNMVKSGVIIIDGGISKKGKKVFGDVDFESVKNISVFLSPVPGGVGPMTVACLLENVLLAFKSQSEG
jgi:methylenetetrahydrofolate dehydrogenase (NADP+)/methenyltetrahydrofolate cyclohydrolase